jgi:hypothetical protein
MRTGFFAIFLALAVLFAGQTAQAQKRLTLEVPVAFNFSGAISGGADSVSGYTVGWAFSQNFGIDYSTITAEASDPASGLNPSVSYTFVDLFAQWMGWGWDWQVGYGMGSVTVDPFTDFLANNYTVDDGDATRFFVSVGWPASKSWTFNVGYHLISAESPNLYQNAVPQGVWDLSGSAWTLGAQWLY